MISLASRHLLYPLYVARILSWDIGESQMFFFIDVHAAFTEIGSQFSSVSLVFFGFGVGDFVTGDVFVSRDPLNAQFGLLRVEFLDGCGKLRF